MIRCIKLRRYEKNTLRVFVDLELARVGLVLCDCTWHQHPDCKEWIGLPAKFFETKNGETAWQPIIEFAEDVKEARERFQEGARATIHAAAAEQEGGS
jgi:hypothetical protein